MSLLLLKWGQAKYYLFIGSKQSSPTYLIGKISYVCYLYVKHKIQEDYQKIVLSFGSDTVKILCWLYVYNNMMHELSVKNEFSMCVITLTVS